MWAVVRDWMLSVSLRMEIFVQSGIDVLWSGKVFARFGDNRSTNQPKKFRWGFKPRSYSSQGRIRADRVFVRTEGGVSMSTLRFITVGETVYVYSASRVFVGSKDVSRLRLRSPTSSTTEEWLVSRRSYGHGIVSLSCRSEFRIAMEFLDCAVDYSSHGARRMSNVIRRRRM